MTSWTTSSRRRGGGRLSEQLAVEFFAVADHQGLAPSERGGSERSAATGDQPGQLGVAESFGLHVDVSKRAAACDVEMRGLAGERDGVPCIDGLAPRIGLLADPGIGLGKEPLRLDAAGSSLAVVIPVDPCGHERRSLLDVRSGGLSWVAGVGGGCG
jgi:hypothetical protein